MKHNGFTNRIATNGRKRASISKEQLKQYFDNTQNELKDVVPCNIWNYDETNLRDNPGAKKYVMKRGTKYPERIMDLSKVAFSVMFCGNAEGEVVPPYVVYKSVHSYYQWVAAGPPGTRYNRSKSGWFDETTFTDWPFTLTLQILHKQEGKKVLVGDNLSSHLSQSVIDECSKHNIAFVCLFPNATHLLQSLDVAWFAPLKKLWRKVLEDWKKSPTGLKHKGALPKEEFSKLLKKLVKRLDENGAASENLVNGFCKYGLFHFNPDAVYELFPSENVMSPQKALDESLLEHLQGIREVPADEAPTKQTKRKRLNLEPGKSISNLDVQDSDEDIISEKDSSFSSESSRTDDDLPADEDENDEETMHIDDINVGDFAVVKYDYSRSMKYYVGECKRKDNNGCIMVIFFERVYSTLFKYRENVIEEVAKVNMVKHILSSPSTTRRGGKLDFISSKEMINSLRFLY